MSGRAASNQPSRPPGPPLYFETAENATARVNLITCLTLWINPAGLALLYEVNRKLQETIAPHVRIIVYDAGKSPRENLKRQLDAVTLCHETTAGWHRIAQANYASSQAKFDRETIDLAQRVTYYEEFSEHACRVLELRVCLSHYTEMSDLIHDLGHYLSTDEQWINKDEPGSLTGLTGSTE